MQSRREELLSHHCADEVAERLRNASDNEGWSKRELAHFLFTMKEEKLFIATAHADTLHFAEAQLDMDHRRTREYIQIGGALLNLELLDIAYCDGEISWSKVRMLLRVIQTETQQAWVDVAKRYTCRELEQEVGGCKPGDLPGEGDDYGLPYEKIQFLAKLADQLFADLEEERVFYSEAPEKLLSNEELLQEFVNLSRRMRGAGARAPAADHGEHERNDEEIPVETYNRVLDRDRYRCCNCSSYLDVHVHHIELRAHGGSNEPDNLISLCERCHASIHRDYLQLEGNPERLDVTFTDARGRPIIRGARAPTV